MKNEEENTKISLCSAVKEGAVQKVMCLLEEEGVIVDERNELGYTLLMVAVMYGHLDVVKALVSAGANITLRSLLYPSGIENDTVLHLAIRHKKPYIIRFLLRQKHTLVNYKNRYGQTPLLLAPHYVQMEILELLISSGADITARDLEGQTVLHSAASAGNLDNFLFLLQLNKIPINTTDMEGNTPLMRVTKWYWKTGKDIAIDALLKAGADINVRDENGNTPVKIAARSDNFYVLKALLRAGSGFSQMGQEECLEILCMLAAVGRPTPCDCMEIYCLACTFSSPCEKKSAGDQIAEVLSAAGVQPNCRDESGNIIPGAPERQIVDVLVTAGVNLNAYAMRRGTPLYNAVESQNKHMVVALIEAGADVNVKDETGSTLVTKAIRQKEILKLLISASADVNAKDSFNLAPLHYAASLDNCEVMDMLLAAGADINISNDWGEVPLLHAISRGKLKSAEYLINKGADGNCAFSHGGTALHAAVKRGYHTLVERLINLKANVNCVGEDGATPLHVAAQHGHKECVNILLSAGAGVNAARKDGTTSVYLAAENGNYEVMKSLVSHGARLTINNGCGETLLHGVAKCGNVEGLNYLLELEVLADITDKNGNTALHSAANAGKIRVVEYFLEKGSIDINKQNCAGQTPLIVSTQPNVVRALLHAGADVNTRDSEGKTALHLATMRHNVQLVKELIAGGAYIGIKDKHNRSALHWAATSGDIETLQCLLKFCSPSQIIENDIPASQGITELHAHEKAAEGPQESTFSVDDQDDEGFTPLMLVVQQVFGSRDNALKLLLQQGAHIEARNWKGKTALHIAIEKSDIWVMRSVLSVGADPKVLEYEYINAALRIAASGGDCQIVKQLITAGAEPATRRPDSGRTVLHLASTAGCAATVEYLLSLNIPVDERDGRGYTALHCAAQVAQVLAAKCLLEKGHAAVDTRDDKGRTPLMMAVKGWRNDTSREDLAEMLLQAGADLQAQDLNGRTPFQIASRHGHPNVIEFLKKLSYTHACSKS